MNRWTQLHSDLKVVLLLYRSCTKQVTSETTKVKRESICATPWDISVPRSGHWCNLDCWI